MGDYRRKADEFWGFAARMRLPVSQPADLDAALCDYSDWKYLDGEQGEFGDKLEAAIKALHPEYQREGKMNLPRFFRTLKGWRKKAPSLSRMLILEQMAFAIAGALIVRGLGSMALWVVTGLSCYLRPSENFLLRTVDVVEPAGGAPTAMKQWVIILAPIERGYSTKTGRFDETVALDDVRVPALGELLGRQRDRRIAEFKAETKATDDDIEDGIPLWPFGTKDLLEAWRRVAKELGLELVAESSYQLRHAGASRDHLMRLRTEPEVIRRGRWADPRSARTYDRPGRVQQLLHRTPQALLDYGEDIRQNFKKYSLAGSCPMPPMTKVQIKPYKAVATH